ncbi:MAG TPA: ABC transporter permease, partial [Roseiarcus sp.]|nr:ABC transporter permease [Roseiarcus sp.]
MKIDGRAFVLPIFLAILMELGARAHGPSDSLAPPSAIAAAFAEALGDGSLLTATRDTLASAFAGLALGGAIGLVLGVALGAAPAANRAFEAAIELTRP